MFQFLPATLSVPMDADISALQVAVESKIQTLEIIGILLSGGGLLLTVITLIVVLGQLRAALRQVELTLEANKGISEQVALALEANQGVRDQVSLSLAANKGISEQIKLAIIANQRIGEGERLLATHQLITKLETDREYLEARQFFASVRDNKIPGKTIQGIIDKYLDNGNANDDEKKEIADDYQKLIRHLNIMEITSVGIATGCYDEGALRLWQRGPYVRNFTAARVGIVKLRDHNHRQRLFIESERLACYWAESGSESENLGSACAARRAEFQESLDKLKKPEAL